MLNSKITFVVTIYFYNVLYEYIFRQGSLHVVARFAARDAVILGVADVAVYSIYPVTQIGRSVISYVSAFNRIARELSAVKTTACCNGPKLIFSQCKIVRSVPSIDFI